MKNFTVEEREECGEIFWAVIDSEGFARGELFNAEEEAQERAEKMNDEQENR